MNLLKHSRSFHKFVKLLLFNLSFNAQAVSNCITLLRFYISPKFQRSYTYPRAPFFPRLVAPITLHQILRCQISPHNQRTQSPPRNEPHNYFLYVAPCPPNIPYHSIWIILFLPQPHLRSYIFKPPYFFIRPSFLWFSKSFNILMAVSSFNSLLFCSSISINLGSVLFSQFCHSQFINQRCNFFWRQNWPRTKQPPPWESVSLFILYFFF